MKLQDIKNKTIEMIKDLSDRGLLIEKQTEVATNGINVIDTYIHIVNQARNEFEVLVISNLIKGLQEGFNFQRVPTISTNIITILQPSKYQNGKISPDHHKVIVCDNTIEKKHWEQIQKKIKKLNKDKPENYKDKIERLEKEQFILAPDNLDVLNNLLCDKAIKEHGGIDVIYIDPPYNTNDINIGYRDVREQNEWLNFMKARLEKAWDLLSDKGVIYISIDDNMQAYLKVLCDQIFGQSKFVANLGIELTKTQGMKVKASKSGSVVKGYEYVLMYSKNNLSSVVKNILYDTTSELYDSHYGNFYDPKITNNSFIGIIDWLDKTKFNKKFFEKYGLSFSKNSINKLMYINEEFKSFIYANSEKIVNVRNIDSDEIQNMEIPLNHVFPYQKYLLYKKNASSEILQLQPMSMQIKETDDFYKEVTRTTIRGTLWKGFDKDLANLNLEGGIDFKNGKKPIRLVKQLIKWVSNDDDYILDFFAGSGTTAEAVLQLNKEDGKKRKFFVCTKKFDFYGQKDGWVNIGEKKMLERIFTITKQTSYDGSKMTDSGKRWANNHNYKEQFDVLETRSYDISLISEIDPYKIIDLNVYSYLDKISLEEKKKIINSKFQILLNHLNK